MLHICSLSIFVYFQHQPLQGGAFTGAIREALSLDWHSRHQRPLCGGGQGEETIPYSLSPTHTQGSGG